MEEESNVLRLAKPKKKGILRLVFSRFLIIALLILLQVLLFQPLPVLLQSVLYLL